jgi:hypothetical protein
LLNTLLSKLRTNHSLSLLQNIGEKSSIRQKTNAVDLIAEGGCEVFRGGKQKIEC